MANSPTIPKERVRIFNRSGSPVAEFRARVTRSFVIGDEGRAEFVYSSRKTDIVNPDVLQFGNWILIENDSVPPWVGVIDTPRNWTTRTVTTVAYTPEHVFSQRIGPLEETLTGSAGTIFEGLINRLNLAEATIIRAGNIWRGGTQRQETINPTPLNENLKALWERSGEDYFWQPTINSNGNLVVYGNWVQFLGAETGALLHEGAGGGNIEATSNIMVEDGPIYNSVLAYGGGESWVSKPTSVVIAPRSIGMYGLREYAEGFDSTTSPATLYANALQRANALKWPARSFSIHALNVGDTFSYLGLGNILNLSLQNVGFMTGGQGYTSRVRIIGMQYDPSLKNKIQLVVREVVSV